MKLNRHQIAGRLVEDPEVTYLPGSGLPAIKLRVMTDDGWYDTKKQEYVKRNTYHTVKQVRKDADNYNLRKDDWVFVEGQKLTDSWEDRERNKKYADFIRAHHIVEIPDPWEKKDSGKGRDRDSGRDDRRDDSGTGRGRGGHDQGRDHGRDSRRDNRDGERDRNGGDDRGRDSARGRGRDDDIPF